MKNCLYLLLVHVDLTEIVRKMPYANASRKDTHNAMTRHESNNRIEHDSLEFQQPCSAPSIQSWLLCPYQKWAASDREKSVLLEFVVSSSIISLQVLIFKNSLESSIAVSHLASSSGLQFTVVFSSSSFLKKYGPILPPRKLGQ